MKKVVIAGEGRCELGDWAWEVQYRPSVPNPGVLEVLARKNVDDGWKVIDAFQWKNIPKLRVGAHRSAETRCVLGLVIKASERGADVVIFVRDLDGDRQSMRHRVEDVEKALKEIPDIVGETPVVVGALAVQRLESWVAAALGHARSEDHQNDKIDAILDRNGCKKKDVVSMTKLLEDVDLSKLPEDATSLRDWLDRVKTSLIG